jgi:hypothetical protein
MRFFDFSRDSMALTILGWTPGLRALASGRVLACGCLSGTYTTWRGGTAVILDARAPACPHAHHRPNLVLWERPGGRDLPIFDEAPSFADPA